MRAALLGIAAAASLYGGVALAQDSAPAAPAPAVFDWTGFYVGVHAGGAWDGQNDHPSETMDRSPEGSVSECPSDINCPGEDAFDLDGIVGGAHAGCNVQSGPFVFGAEADLVGSGMD